MTNMLFVEEEITETETFSVFDTTVGIEQRKGSFY
ncbi:MAG: hypothetical protein ACI8RD_004206 [Bacillariaceae sp.]|jgi:hypothetical protein